MASVVNRWATLVAVAAGLAASQARAGIETAPVYDPYFIGFEREPAMDYGGRDIATVQSAISRGLGWAIHVDRYPAVAAAYEVFFAAGLSTVQHEVFGHGSRGREFNLDPSYGFGFDFSGSTSLGKDPRDNEQNIVLAAGGTEGDSILAHRILRDLYTGDGADGAKIPLMALGKLDFSLYCFITPDPARRQDRFRDAYTNGNDIAYYLAGRQAQRTGGDPAAVWNNAYAIDFSDRLLADNYRDLRAAAIWNLADPAALASVYGYVADHLLRGRPQVKPPVIPLGGGYGVTAGTRAFLGPEEVTRFLDVYLVTPGPLLSVYGRDLQSSVDESLGWGGGVYGLRLGDRWTANVAGDYWKTPESAEGLYRGNGWNACAEFDAMIFKNWGLSGKIGAKSSGYFPGTPMDSGAYAGAGLLVAF